MRWLFEAWVAVEDCQGIVARKFHNLCVGCEVCDVELEGLTTLLCAVYVTCAT